MVSNANCSGIHVELHEDWRAALLHSTHATHLLEWAETVCPKSAKGSDSIVEYVDQSMLTLRALRHQQEVSTEWAPPLAPVSPMCMWAMRAPSKRAREWTTQVCSSQFEWHNRGGSVERLCRCYTCRTEGRQDQDMCCVLYLTLTYGYTSM